MNCPDLMVATGNMDCLDSNNGCNPRVLQWYYKTVGEDMCPYVYGTGSVATPFCGAGCTKPWSSKCADY